MSNSNYSSEPLPSSSEITKVVRFLNSQAYSQLLARAARQFSPLEWNRAFLSLHFEAIDLRTALRLNRLWHSRLPQLDHRVASWLCFGASRNGCLCATAIWSLPVARMLPQDGSCLELRRFAIAPESPKNTASRMLGWMAREIPRLRPAVHRLVSYHDCAVHTGAIYKASGWVPVRAPSGGDWNHRSRRRAAARIISKVRWELFLHPQIER